MTRTLPANWSVTTLGECADWYSGGTPRTEVAEYWDGNIPWITASSLHEFYVEDSERRVTQLGVENGTRLMPKDTILFVVRGMSLKTEFRVGIARRPVTFGQDCKAIIAHEEIDPLFLANVLRAKKTEILGMVDEASHGTGRLQTELIQRLEVPLPPLPTQRRIADILSALDDKIELNRQTNATLEAMAQAIFKEWFVDFNCPGSTALTTSGATGELVDSELGLIPAGWRVGRLEDVLVLQRGFDLPSTKRTAGEYPVLAASGPSETHNEFMVKGPGVTTGRSGVLGKVFYVHENFWPLNTSLWVKEFKNSSPLYAFHLLQGIDFKGFNAGSAVPTLNRNHVHSLPALLPPMEIIYAFDEIICPLMKRQKANEDESAVLIQLRDSLLPKLMRGEIEI